MEKRSRGRHVAIGAGMGRQIFLKENSAVVVAAKEKVNFLFAYGHSNSSDPLRGPTLST